MGTIAIIKRGFATVGLLLLIACIVLAITTTQFISEAAVTTGTVVSMERSSGDEYSPVVAFQAIGHGTIRFTSSFSSYPPRHHIGQKVEVIYDPKSPSNARINSFLSLWFGPMIIGGLGIVFSSIGFGMILHAKARERVIRRLKESGLPVETQFQRVEENQSLTVNKRHPYRLVSHWTDDDELHVFKSDNIWSDISDEVMVDKITVFIDPDNMSKYYMDISFLP